MSVPKVLALAAGGALTLAKAGDAVVYGKMKGDVYAQNVDANGLTRTFLNSQTMQQPDAIADGARKWLFKTDMDHNVRQPFGFVGGFVKGFFTSLVNNIVPVALGVGTLFSIRASGAEKTAKNTLKTARQNFKAGTGTQAAIDNAKTALTNAGKQVKPLRIGLAIASAAVIAGTAIAAMIGAKNKTTLDNNNYK